jgi:hypothetical protein
VRVEITRAEPVRTDPAKTVSSVTAAEAKARLRATMPAHIAAAARVARVTPRAMKTLESGELEIVYDARWGLVRGRPCLTWNESTRELSVSVKRLFRERLVHTFPVRSPEHFGVIAQTAMSLVVGRARLGDHGAGGAGGTIFSSCAMSTGTCTVATRQMTRGSSAR